jgi:tellurium resistance protein TerZ
MISLEKGQRISLEKNGGSLDKICVGINWGAIDKKGFFGGTKKEAVDLDASIGMFDNNKTPVDVVYFGQLSSKDGSIRHSGDDQTGDVDGDDGLDNEVIQINLSKVPAAVTTLAVVLNSYKNQDFANIPFASLRMYEGTPSRVDNVLASYNIANDAKFAGKTSMVLGNVYRHGDSWKFRAIGEPTEDTKLEGLINSVVQHYL